MNLLSRRRTLMSAVNDLLPSQYQQVEYIESTGKQWIDTGVIPNNETGFILTLALPEVQADVFRFGCRQDSGNTRFLLANKEGEFYVGFGTSNGRDWSCFENVFHTAEVNFLNSRMASVDNKIPIGLGQISVNFTYSLIMFGRNSAGSITSSAQKIKACKISQGNTIIRNFIPCYRKADNKVGMYDIINGVFYTNNGTGEFLVGGGN